MKERKSLPRQVRGGNGKWNGGLGEDGRGRTEAGWAERDDKFSCMQCGYGSLLICVSFGGKIWREHMLPMQASQ